MKFFFFFVYSWKFSQTNFAKIVIACARPVWQLLNYSIAHVCALKLFFFIALLKRNNRKKNGKNWEQNEKKYFCNVTSLAITHVEASSSPSFSLENFSWVAQFVPIGYFPLAITFTASLSLSPTASYTYIPIRHLYTPRVQLCVFFPLFLSHHEREVNEKSCVESFFSALPDHLLQLKLERNFHYLYSCGVYIYSLLYCYFKLPPHRLLIKRQMAHSDAPQMHLEIFVCAKFLHIISMDYVELID